MSFFYDFLENVSVGGLKNELMVSIVLGYKIMVGGNFKIKTLSDDFVEIEHKKINYKIIGEELKIESLSKGEIVVLGNVFGFVRGSLWENLILKFMD